MVVAFFNVESWIASGQEGLLLRSLDFLLPLSPSFIFTLYNFIHFNQRRRDIVLRCRYYSYQYTVSFICLSTLVLYTRAPLQSLPLTSSHARTAAHPHTRFPFNRSRCSTVKSTLVVLPPNLSLSKSIHPLQTPENFSDGVLAGLCHIILLFYTIQRNWLTCFDSNNSMPKKEGATDPVTGNTTPTTPG